nr:MAG TPA: hypothetical protein [Caudoviricetes sp.]
MIKITHHFHLLFAYLKYCPPKVSTLNRDNSLSL